MNKKKYILTILMFVSNLIVSDELVWTPINPSFGGNPYNATWLMNSAKIQNQYPEEVPDKDYQKDPLEQFQENLNRQLLRRLASSIVDQIYGDSGVNEGSYSVGDYLIDIEERETSVVIMIDDMATGNQTLMEIPNF